MAKIYFAAPPFEGVEVSEKEAKEYLKCKFYYKNALDAQAYYLLYPNYAVVSLSSIAYVLSGEHIGKEKDITIYGDVLSLFKNNEESRFWFLDDFIVWGRTLKVISLKLINQIKNDVKEHRSLPLFRQKINDHAVMIKIFSDILKTPSVHNIFKSDLEVIFNYLENDWAIISDAINSDQIRGFLLKSTDDQVIDKHSLVEWLVKNKKVPFELKGALMEIERLVVLEDRQEPPVNVLTIDGLIKELDLTGRDLNPIVELVLSGKCSVYIKCDDFLERQI